MHSYIKAISYYLPEEVYTNEDYFRDFPEQRQSKNLHKTGVQQRAIARKDELASDLGVLAAEKLFSEHSISRNEIDFLVFCAGEFDYPFPTTSTLLQDRLGLPLKCGTIDMVVGCSGYIYALNTAKGLVELNRQKNVLLINASTLTKEIHPKDKASRFLFGDGAAATVVADRASEGIGLFEFGSDGSRYDKIIRRHGGARFPLSGSSYEETEDAYGNRTSNGHFYMNGASVFNFATHTVPVLIEDTVKKNDVTIDRIDLFIFHQANLFLIETIVRLSKIKEEKVFNYMTHTGNTVSPSIPIVLYEAMKAGKAKTGDKIMLCGFGVGLSWGATVITL